MKEIIKGIFKESIRVKEETLAGNIDQMTAVVKMVTEGLKRGRKVILFGNGGSAADSQHIAAEFIGRFQNERKALAAVALTTDTSILTALSNDYGYAIVFSRQIEGLGQKGDIAWGISTSGNSANVIQGIKTARRLGLKTISSTGCGGGKLAKLTDISLIVPSRNTARIQESHMCMAHAICELVEKQFS
jgi:D-sedoheptulose 7-phosphate isomerase